MPQQEFNLPLRRTKEMKPVRPTNLYIPEKMKQASAINARDRYGYSLSRLVRELLARENHLKGGLLKARMFGEKA